MANPALETELRQAHDYFMQVNASYDRVDACQAKIMNLQHEQDAVGLIPVFSKVFAALYVIVFMLSISILERLAYLFPLMISYIPFVGGALSAFIDKYFIIVFFAVPFLLVRQGNKLLCKNKYAKLAAALETEKRNLGMSYKPLCEHYQSYEANMGVPCPLAFDYSDPDVITQIASYVQLGRADTLKEALNLLASDAQQAELLRTQQATLLAAQQAVVEAQNATRAAERAETAAWLS